MIEVGDRWCLPDEGSTQYGRDGGPPRIRKPFKWSFSMFRFRGTDFRMHAAFMLFAFVELLRVLIEGR